MSTDTASPLIGTTNTFETVYNAIQSQAKAAAKPSRYSDVKGNDDLDHHINSHRTQLESIDVQIANLDRTIELEQQKLRDTKSSLEKSYHARKRLLHLRLAMVHFVQELEASQVDE
jgi:2C-methyl-D-erythritol 2,4-cyclodiphosphate synthase